MGLNVAEQSVAAELIPLAKLGNAVPTLDPEQELVLHCHSGARSAWAAGQLRAHHPPVGGLGGDHLVSTRVVEAGLGEVGRVVSGERGRIDAGLEELGTDGVAHPRRDARGGPARPASPCSPSRPAAHALQEVVAAMASRAAPSTPSRRTVISASRRP